MSTAFGPMVGYRAFDTNVSNLKANGTASLGTLQTLPRTDHVHPSSVSIYTATITTTWTGASAPYTQAVTVTGILATDVPEIIPVYSATNATAVLEKTAWASISKADTSANTITFTCFEDKPTQAINIKIKVVR